MHGFPSAHAVIGSVRFFPDRAIIPHFQGASMKPEPCYDLAHLAHVEMLTPKPEQSLRFFVDILGMQESGRSGDSVYLRGWDDYEHHTLKLTAAKTSGIGHFAFRTTSEQALHRRVAALQASGASRGWTRGDIGHGPAFTAQDPDGHLIELYYETEWYAAPPDLKPALKNQAQRFPARGVNVRRLDHLNLLAVDVRGTRLFLESNLGLRTTEQIVFEEGEMGAWFTATNKSYDLAYTLDHTGMPGRLHHVTYAVDSAKRCCAPPTSSSRTASTSKPARTSTRCNKLSSSMGTSPAAIASRSAMPAHG